MMLPTPISTEEFVQSLVWQQWMSDLEARLLVLGDFTDDDVIKPLTHLPPGLRESLLLTPESTPEY
eukprot:6357222-Prorocentrum_lima.AAC.1